MSGRVGVKQAGVMLAAALAGVLLACGSDAAGGAARPREDAGLGNADAVAAAAPDAVDCPPTRVISDVSDDPSATASGAAVNIMSVWCTGCHAPGAAQRAPSGPLDATDFNGMIDDGYVIDCDGEGSPIVIGMRAGEMPPLDYLGIQPSSADIDPIVTFIELDCSDAENACAESPSQPGCGEVLAARRARRCAW
jgi:hypothetical protein